MPSIFKFFEAHSSFKSWTTERSDKTESRVFNVNRGAAINMTR